MSNHFFLLFDLLSFDCFFPLFSIFTYWYLGSDMTAVGATHEPSTAAPLLCQGSGAGTGCETKADAENKKY